VKDSEKNECPDCARRADYPSGFICPTCKRTLEEPPDALSRPVTDGAAGKDLADRIIADPKVVWLRECGFQSSARFESELRAAIMRAVALTPQDRQGKNS
jgi:hypothetical protein